MKALAIGFALAVGLAGYTAWNQIQSDVPNWHVPAASLLWGILWFTPLTMFVSSFFERTEPEQSRRDVPQGWRNIVVPVAGLLLFLVYIKSMSSLIDGSNVCRSWADDGRFCRSALFIATPFLLAGTLILFGWLYERRPVLRPILSYATAAILGLAVGAAICLVRSDWNLHIVAIATLMGPLLWLNRRLLFPAMLLEVFDRTPNSK